MRRIGRYILNGITVLSLVLCVAMVGLWVRSYSSRDRWEGEIWTSPRWPLVRSSMSLYTRVRVARGHVFAEIHRQRGDMNDDDRRPPEYAWRGRQPFFHQLESQPLPEESAHFSPLLRITYHPPYVDALLDFWTAAFALWPLVLVSSVLPAAWLVRRVRKARLRDRGLCSKCAYDLRATPDRCPECGTIPTKAKA